MDKGCPSTIGREQPPAVPSKPFRLKIIFNSVLHRLLAKLIEGRGDRSTHDSDAETILQTGQSSCYSADIMLIIVGHGPPSRGFYANPRCARDRKSTHLNS